MESIAPVFDNKPYIFFSYSHKNPLPAMRILNVLQEEGFRVWYDDGHEGLLGGDRYNQIIDVRIMDCDVLIPALSREYCTSRYCPLELAYAIEKLQKPIVPVFLEHPSLVETYYPPGLGLLMTGQSGFVLDDNSDLADFRRKIHKVKSLLPCNKAFDDKLSSLRKSAVASAANRTQDHLPPSDGSEKDVYQSEAVRGVIDGLLETVRADVDAGNYPMAQANIKKILEVEPGNADARFYELLAGYNVNSSEALASLTSPIDPADIRAASIYLERERREALSAALSRNQQYQKYLVATSHMSAGRYDRALDVFQTIPDYENTAEKMSECREQIEHDTLLKQYKENVGNGEKYLAQQLKKESPDIFAAFSDLCDKTKYSPHKGIFSIIIGILHGITGYGLIVYPSNKILVGIAIVFAALYALLFGVSNSNAVLGICVMALMGILLYFKKFLIGVTLIIVATIWIADGFKTASAYKKHSKILAEKKAYYKAHIEPFEKEMRKRTEDEYSSLLPKEKKSLLSVEQGILKMKKQ